MVTEISYLKDVMDTSEGWKVVIISVQTELAYICRDQMIIMPCLIYPSTSVADPQVLRTVFHFGVQRFTVELTDSSPGYPHPHTPFTHSFDKNII